jgi:hypothetical protein
MAASPSELDAVGRIDRHTAWSMAYVLNQDAMPVLRR